jgi:6-pyruvoyltetrahydropterin/6-carboxytetrahydropterin synthase
MIYITRREHFNAAHKLARPDWSEEQNLEIFGKCSNPNWHGHNYTLFVTIKGTVNPETGFVTDLKALSTIIKTEVINKLDHKNINLDVEFMKGILASTENLTIAIWKILNPLLKGDNYSLHGIKLY